MGDDFQLCLFRNGKRTRNVAWEGKSRGDCGFNIHGNLSEGFFSITSSRPSSHPLQTGSAYLQNAIALKVIQKILYKSNAKNNCIKRNRTAFFSFRLEWQNGQKCKKKRKKIFGRIKAEVTLLAIFPVQDYFFCATANLSAR